jgi:citrate lyase gamma subunit
MFDFLTIRKSIAALQDQHDNLHLEAQELERKANAIQVAPLHRSDIKLLVDSWIAQLTQKFGQAVENRIIDQCRNGMSVSMREFGFFGLMSEPGGARFEARQLDAAVCATFGASIKNTIYSVIDSMDWPNEGLPSAKRQAEVQRIRNRQSEIASALDRLVNEAHEAGVNLK